MKFTGEFVVLGRPFPEAFSRQDAKAQRSVIFTPVDRSGNAIFHEGLAEVQQEPQLALQRQPSPPHSPSFLASLRLGARLLPDDRVLPNRQAPFETAAENPSTRRERHAPAQERPPQSGIL